MSSLDEYQKIFSVNLKYQMEMNNVKQQDLIDQLGFKSGSVSAWCSGTRIPRMDKIQKLADFFGIKVSDLLEERNVDDMRDDFFKKKKILFDLSEKATPEDLDKILLIVNTIIGED